MALAATRMLTLHVPGATVEDSNQTSKRLCHKPHEVSEFKFHQLSSNHRFVTSLKCAIRGAAHIRQEQSSARFASVALAACFCRNGFGVIA